MINVLKKVLIGGGAVAACVMCGSTFGTRVVQNFSQVGSAKKAYGMDVKKSGDLVVNCTVRLDVTKNSVNINVDKKNEGSVVKLDNGMAVIMQSETIGVISSSVPGKVTVKLARLTSKFHDGDYHALLLTYDGGTTLLTKTQQESGEIEISSERKIELKAVLLEADKKTAVKNRTKFEDFCDTIKEQNLNAEKDLSCTYSVDVSMK